jgi:hypothetical protein
MGPERCKVEVVAAAGHIEDEFDAWTTKQMGW